MKTRGSNCATHGRALHRRPAASPVLMSDEVTIRD